MQRWHPLCEALVGELPAARLERWYCTGPPAGDDADTDGATGNDAEDAKTVFLVDMRQRWDDVVARARALQQWTIRGARGGAGAIVSRPPLALTLKRYTPAGTSASPAASFALGAAARVRQSDPRTRAALTQVLRRHLSDQVHRRAVAHERRRLQLRRSGARAPVGRAPAAAVSSRRGLKRPAAGTVVGASAAGADADENARAGTDAYGNSETASGRGSLAPHGTWLLEHAARQTPDSDASAAPGVDAEARGRKRVPLPLQASQSLSSQIMAQPLSTSSAVREGTASIARVLRKADSGAAEGAAIALAAAALAVTTLITGADADSTAPPSLHNV
jgi:hypothetical protein